MKHLWFDPGGTTGWALYHNNNPVEMGILRSANETWLFLNRVGIHMPVDLIGYETYRIRPRGMKQGYTPVGDDLWTSQVIGAIKFRAWNLAKTPVEQDPSIKPAGYGYAGLLPYNPKKKGMHLQDAIAHGAFWWMEVGSKRGHS